MFKLSRVGQVVFTYFAVTAIVLLSGYFFPTEGEMITSISMFLSVLLLVPLYFWQRNRGRNAELQSDVKALDKGDAVFWILTLFFLAMFVRIPSVLLFGIPYEKTALVYLAVLTILLLERTRVSSFGFKKEHIGKSLLYGLVFFIVLDGLALLLDYALVYAFTGQQSVVSYDVWPFLLFMPFMTLCVGISEEGLFRGYMQTHLAKSYSLGKAILGQALLFGVWHFVWNLVPFDPPGMSQYVAVTFFVGIIFGYFFSKTKNLVPLVFAHGLVNSVPQGLILNESAINVVQGLQFELQAALLILPYVVPALLVIVWIKYFVKEI